MLPAGRYYVGDLCYVMHPEWTEVCRLINGGNRDGGEFTLADGRRFALHDTMYGDGVYPCSNGSTLGVDAGLIGCILVSDIRDAGAQSEAALLERGTIIDFPVPFSSSRDSYGNIRFGLGCVVSTGDIDDDAEAA